MTKRGKQALLAGCMLALFVAGGVSWRRVCELLDSTAKRKATSATQPSSPTLPPHGTGDSAPRHPAGTPGRMMRGVVRAQEVDEWTLRFAGGQPARIWVAAEGHTSLDCVVQDAAGKLLDVDADETRLCQLRWVPTRTGGYRVMIRNSGSVSSSYRLVTR